MKINLSPRPLPVTQIHWSSQCRNYPMRRSVSAFGFQQVNYIFTTFMIGFGFFIKFSNSLIRKYISGDVTGSRHSEERKILLNWIPRFRFLRTWVIGRNRPNYWYFFRFTYETRMRKDISCFCNMDKQIIRRSKILNINLKNTNNVKYFPDFFSTILESIFNNITQKYAKYLFFNET